MEPMERLALSRGNARQFTKLLLSLLSHIGKMVGCLGIAPSSRRLRAGTSLLKFATQVAVCKDRDAKAELNHRGQFCEVLTGTGILRRGKESQAHRIRGPAITSTVRGLCRRT